MKQETVHALLTAKTLLDEARNLIASTNQYACSAGLVLLQDALEIVFLASLREIGVDQTKSVESFSFDQLVGELVANKIGVPKSGTLKALNKQRVIVKHYGQLADPVSTLGYLNAASEAISEILKHVIAKDLNDVFLSDLLPGEHKAKCYLQEAAKHIEAREFYEALLATRKAYFVEIESDYCIYSWKDISSAEQNYWKRLAMGGFKAPFHTRNREWISTNVHQPSDYVQLDHDRFRMDAVEWGVNTSELHNVSQFTPQVVQLEHDGPWHTRVDDGFRENLATEANAKYCLDRMIAIAFRKHQHQSVRRWKPYGLPKPPRPVYLTHPVFERPDIASRLIHNIQEGFTYSVNYQATGFDPSISFLNITVHPPRAADAPLGEGPYPFSGFVVDYGS